MTATLQGIAFRSARKAPMQTGQSGFISIETGLAGDHKGAKHKTRQITVLAEEDWAAACADLGGDALLLKWTVRRANLLTRGLRLPRVKGAVLAIGPVRLEVTGQTYPCRRMDEAYPGLLKALAPNWRGGVTCRVLNGGNVSIGDAASLVSSPPEPSPRVLPG